MYVGKAKNLRNRLRSYVQKNADKAVGPWRRSFYAMLADFDVTVTNTELEALVLETNLIKQLRPKYNVLMKDDKHYIYVEVTVNDEYPRVDTERKMMNPKAKYFGPFLSAWETRQTLDMLNEIFCFRTCKASIEKLNKHPEISLADAAPCLDYQIGQCCGMCGGIISKEEYRSRINQVLHFFKGDYKPVLEKGRELMMDASKNKKFERAAKLRDMLGIIESLQERQLVSDTSGENVDVIGLALLAGKVQVVVFQKRAGKLIGEQHFSLMGAAESIADVLEQFLPQYYEDVADIPDAVILGEDFPSKIAFEEFLSERRGKKVKVIIPERGHKSQLLQLAETNAQEKAKQAEASWEADKRNTESALNDLTSILELSGVPKRIEGYDISHTGGTETVGSMVVCIDGKPKNDHYRSFTIHSMQRGAIDDYRALKEVLTRRLRHAAGGLAFEEDQWESNGITFGKALKADDAVIKEIIARFPGELSQSNIDYKQFLVARHDGNIIGFIRLREHEGKLTELSSLWVEEEYRGGKLGQFLARKILSTVKKGKIYIRIFPELEQYYASVGFRHVLKSPQQFQEKWEAYKKEHPDPSDPARAGARERYVMVYDATQNKPDISLGTKPDLIVIDGGKGQLGVGVEVLKNFGLDIPVIGLAKREEEVFVPGKPVSLLIPHDSPAKFLLMRLRDEAHRFANRHRERRAFKSAVASKLDSIPSIGPETKQLLMREFGSLDAVRSAPDDTLKKILTEEQVEQLRQVL